MKLPNGLPIPPEDWEKTPQSVQAVVVMLYVDLLTTGAEVIKAGLRHLADHKDRRDISVFRIGLYLRERHLVNSQSCFDRVLSPKVLRDRRRLASFSIDFYPTRC